MPLCARLTSPGRGVPLPSANQARVGDAMVRSAERPGMQESSAILQQSRDRVNLRRFQRLRESQRR